MAHKKELSKLFMMVSMLLIGVMIGTMVTPVLGQTTEQWCADKHIRFFAGGDEGDAFASIVLRGAQQADEDLGADVDYIFSGWNSERMIQQLREAIAAQPDGIAMMGHPSDAAIMPLAEEAAAAGIRMMYQNVDVPQVRAAFGGGYVGANLGPQGQALGEEAVRQFGLAAGDTAIVFGPFNDSNRSLRESATADALEAAGLNVVRLVGTPEMATDPNLALPILTAAVVDNPDVKLVAYPGGQMLGNAQAYMEALDKGPGEILNIGFDTSPLIMQAFEGNWVQLTSDQQPFLQGYLPILSLCLSDVYGFGPLTVDTGAGFVDSNNYQNVAEWATAGIR